MYASWIGRPDDGEPVYRAVVPDSAHPELVEEEFALFLRLVALMEERLPNDVPEERMGEFLPQARSEDPEVAAVADRFEEVLATHKGSMIRTLWENEHREASE